MKKLTVANLNIEMDYIDKHFFGYILRNYENNHFTQPDMILHTRLVDEIKKPPGDILEQICDATIVGLGNKRFCRYLSDSQSGEIAMASYYDQSYEQVEIQFSKIIQPRDASITEYEYLYTGFAFSDRLVELGGAVLHGSAIAYENQGIVFSANSGTGKSTHTRLWKECFGNQVKVVNDDKPAIRFYNEVPYIFGTPWSGKSDLNDNVRVQLGSIVFIKRAETNWIEKLNTRDSIFNLMSQISRPYYDEKIGLKTMGIIEQLVKTIPVYRLHCNTSPAAVNVVLQRLRQEGVIDS